MGACMSTVGIGGGPYVSTTDGGEEEYRARYVEGDILGQGEFGAVKLCKDRTSSTNDELAVKILKKGITFKDNTVYGALKPEVLQAECDILKTLNGKRYCLELKGIYETPKVIYVVTELCSGGEMMEYVSKHPELRTEDVSRISYQLLSAVDHCDKHGIIHRDIKADNCMFVSNSPTAELRLIDFGCGVHDTKTNTPGDVTQHSTFAGSAFYISPEMFQHTYTSATDVWSTGVTLYVLTAGYPADELQKAFNVLQKSNHDMRKLPNLPSNLPDSYYEMLDKLCTYHYKSRPSAGDMLNDEFVSFHKQFAKSKSTGKRMKASRTASVLIQGSGERHALVLDYQTYERSVTTLLATMLSREHLDRLLVKLDSKQQTKSNVKLNIITIGELKKVLLSMNQQQVVEMMDALPNASGYDSFSYHIPLLKQFSRSPPTGSGGRPRQQRSMSISAGTMKKNTDMVSNVRRASITSSQKMNGTSASTTSKPIRSQSVVVSRKPTRSQSVVVTGTTSINLDDLKSFDAPTIPKSNGSATNNGVKKFKPTPMPSLSEDKSFRQTSTTATTPESSLEEGEFDC